MSVAEEGHAFDSEARSNDAQARWDSPWEAAAGSLLPGEQALLFVECLRRRRMHIFERAAIAITDKRLLVVAPAFPWGNQLDGAYDLANAWVVNGKERLDGSRLMILRTDDGVLCLYFGRAHRNEADALLTLVGLDPAGAPAPIDPVEVPQDAGPGLDPHADFVEVTMELSDLSHVGEPQEED